MKKSVLILTILLSFSFFGVCQNFAPIGAQWHYGQTETSPPFQQSYILIESVKDTIVLGKNAKKLNKTLYLFNGNTASLSDEIVYSDSNKVYLFRYNQFHLLYDFNANQGDTIYIVEPVLNRCGGNGDTLIEVLVDSVKMENIGGVIKKVQYVRNVESFWVIGAKFIESIGSNHYFLPIDCGFPPLIDSLRCYSDSVINYQLVVDCEELVTGLGEINQENKYPIQTIVYDLLILPDIDGQLVIYNLQGRVIRNEKINGNIDLKNLNNGIYILILKNDTLLYKHKLIKL